MNKAGNIPNLAVPLIIVGFVLAGLMFGVLFDPIYGWAVLVAGLCGCMLLGYPKRVILGYWVWGGVMEVVLSVVGHPVIRFADEMIVLAVAGIALMQYITSRNRYTDLRVFWRLAFFLVAVTILSALLNTAPPKLAFHFVLSYLAFIPVFYLAYTCLRPSDMRVFVVVLIGMLFIQLVLNLGWLAGVNPLPNFWQGRVDFAIGSFSAQNSVAYLSILVVVTMIGLFRLYRGAVHRAFMVFVALLALFQLYITYTNHAYFLLILVLGVYYLLVSPQFRHRWALLLALVAATTTAVLLFTLTPTLGEMGLAEFSTYDAQGFRQRWALAVEGPKGKTLIRVLTEVPDSAPLLPFIGAGPGNFLSSIGIINVAPLAKEYIGEYFLTYSGRMDYAGGSILQHAKTGYLAIYSELGFLGLFLYVGIHCYAVLRAFRFYRAGRYTSPAQKLAAELLVVQGVIYGLINALSEFFYFDFWYLTFWILAAIAWTPRVPEQSVETEDVGEETQDIPFGLRVRRPAGLRAGRRPEAAEPSA